MGKSVNQEVAFLERPQQKYVKSVMYRPIKKSFKELYSIDGYDASVDRQRLMKGAPVGIISAAVVFFYSIVNELLVASQSYSQKELMKAETTLEKDNSVLNMDGSVAYTHFVEVIRQNINQLQSSTT